MSDAFPVPADQLRVGDDERQQAVAALGEHFAAGRLDREEFDSRVQAAYAGRTRVDLRALFGDLPEPAPFRPERAPDRTAGRPARPPVFTLVLILAVFVTVSAVLRFPVFPLLFLLLFLAWRTGAIGSRRPGPWGNRPGSTR